MSRTVTVAEITENLRAVRASASPAHVTEGRTWYGRTMADIRAIAGDAADNVGDYGVTDSMAVGWMAAFSQNQTWKGNVTMFTRYVNGFGLSGLPSVVAEVQAIEEGADPTDYTVLGLKRADFCANMLGDMSRVTCDRWHLRAAYALHRYVTADTPRPRGVQWVVKKNKRTGAVISEGPAVKLTEKVHAAVTEATRVVAAEYGETPAECQAVIWCAIRGTGA